MQISRRHTLLVAATAPFALAAAPARAEDPRLSDRSIGKPDAPVSCLEFYSLTCPHCARFAIDVLPEIKEKLIDTGKLRLTFREFPLDKLALIASAIARSLPQERYEPFTHTLLASQDRWAFARGINNTEELWKRAALAGMPRATFDAAIADRALQTAILEAQDADSKTYGIDSTPTFVFNGPGAKNQRESGERSYNDFAALVAKAAG